MLQKVEALAQQGRDQMIAFGIGTFQRARYQILQLFLLDDHHGGTTILREARRQHANGDPCNDMDQERD